MELSLFCSLQSVRFLISYIIIILLYITKYAIKTKIFLFFFDFFCILFNFSFIGNIVIILLSVLLRYYADCVLCFFLTFNGIMLICFYKRVLRVCSSVRYSLCLCYIDVSSQTSKGNIWLLFCVSFVRCLFFNIKYLVANYNEICWIFNFFFSGFANSIKICIALWDNA